MSLLDAPTSSPDDQALTLRTIERCFRGAVPAVLATADADGVPNVTYLSRAHAVDDHRIALSNQFMSKSSRNLALNPLASLLLVDPLTYDAYRIALRYERTERRGIVFERLRADIDALAELTGMQHVFRLRAADVFRVLDIVRIPPNAEHDRHGADQAPLVRDRTHDLAELAVLGVAIARAGELSTAIDVALDGLARRFGYAVTYLLLVDDSGERLTVVGSHGDEAPSVGLEVACCAGMIGAVAARCEPCRVGGLRRLEKYTRGVRRQYEDVEACDVVDATLPWLTGVDSLVAVPAMVGGHPVGVLVAESREPAAFDAGDEHVLSVVAALLAAAADTARRATPDGAPPPSARPPDPDATIVRFFELDGSVFVDGEYLIRGVAGRILWTLLVQYVESGRTEFSNKELRLDPSLDLPGFKDNLESRLLLLRQRLDQRQAPFRVARTGRGRFRLIVDDDLSLDRVGG